MEFGADAAGIPEAGNQSLRSYAGVQRPRDLHSGRRGSAAAREAARARVRPHGLSESGCWAGS